MKWTKETPTKEGAYWLRADCETWRKPEIVGFHLMANDAGFYVYFLGSEVGRGQSEIPENVEWAGPILPPQKDGK